MNKKIISALAAFFISACLVSCTSQQQNDQDLNTAETSTAVSSAFDTESSIPEKILLSPDAVMSIGGHEVSDDEYKYYFAYAKYSIDNGDENYWKDDENGLKINDLKSQTYNYLYSLYTIYSLADKENISLDENDLNNIQKQFESVRDYYNASNIHLGMNFEAYLKNTCCTEKVYLETLKRSKIENKVISKLFEKDFRDKFFKDYIRVLYINIKPEIQYEYDENGNRTDRPAVFYQINPLLSYTEEEKSGIDKLNELSLSKNTEGLKSEIPVFMNIIKDRIEQGESFDSLIEKYSMKKDTPRNNDGTYQGYYINKTEMPDKFSDAAFTLSEDSISEIIESGENGWYIIERKPYDENYLEDYLISIYMSSPEYGYSDKYTEICSEAQKKMDTVFSEKYDNITYDYASINYNLN